MLNSNLDLIDEIIEETMKRMAKHKEAMARYYNRKVKVRRFNTRDLILRKVSHKGPIPRKIGTGLGRPLLGNSSF